MEIHKFLTKNVFGFSLVQRKKAILNGSRKLICFLSNDFTQLLQKNMHYYYINVVIEKRVRRRRREIE